MNAITKDSGRTPGRSTVGTIVYLLFGPILWEIHLTVIYGSQSTLCAISGTGAGGPVAVATAIVTTAALATLAAAIAKPGGIARILKASGWLPAEQAFHERVMVLLAMLSVFGIVLAGAAALILPACASLR